MIEPRGCLKHKYRYGVLRAADIAREVKFLPTRKGSMEVNSSNLNHQIVVIFPCDGFQALKSTGANWNGAEEAGSYPLGI